MACQVAQLPALWREAAAALASTDKQLALKSRRIDELDQGADDLRSHRPHILVIA